MVSWLAWLAPSSLSSFRFCVCGYEMLPQFIFPAEWSSAMYCRTFECIRVYMLVLNMTPQRCITGEQACTFAAFPFAFERSDVPPLKEISQIYKFETREKNNPILVRLTWHLAQSNGCAMGYQWSCLHRWFLSTIPPLNTRKGLLESFSFLDFGSHLSRHLPCSRLHM